MSNSSRNNKLHVLTEADVRAVKTGLEKSKARPPTTLRNRDKSIRPHPDRIFFKVSEEDDVLPAMADDTPGEAVCDYWVLNADGDFEELVYGEDELSQITIKSNLPYAVYRESGIWSASRAALGYYWVDEQHGAKKWARTKVGGIAADSSALVVLQKPSTSAPWWVPDTLEVTAYNRGAAIAGSVLVMLAMIDGRWCAFEVC
jgi:hypothetical protein